ncbi:unnamed protein product [Closterium sp. Naga37s-1]|nr:unnamed protein product [Closterium sp. Naga37s-1]
MAAAECAPQFREFQWLPETAKALIAASLSPKDAVSLALTCKDLRCIARPFTAREFACKACGARLFSPRALIPCTTRPSPPPSAPPLSPAGSSFRNSSRASPNVLLFPPDASTAPPAGAPSVPLLLLLDDGAAACVQGGEVEEGGAIRALHSNVPFIAVPRLYYFLPSPPRPIACARAAAWGRACAHLMDAATLHCARCLLFLGIQVRTVFPRLAASPSPPASASPSPAPAFAASHTPPPGASSPTAASPAPPPSAPPSSHTATSAPPAHAHAAATEGAAAAAGGAGQQLGLYAAEAKAFLVRKYLDLLRPASYPGLVGASPPPPLPTPAPEPSAAAAVAAGLAEVAAAGGGGQGRVQVYADGLSGEGDGRHAVLCSGRRGHVGGGSGAQGKAPCLNVLFHSHQVLFDITREGRTGTTGLWDGGLGGGGQVLSARHCWDAGSGTEVAVYCNALHPGAFLLAPPRTEELAQGAMQVADVACARCHAPIGWKFCSLAGHGTDLRNLNQYSCCLQVGRFGIVLSSIHRGKEFLPAWRAASVWEDSEEYEEEEEEEEDDEEDEDEEEEGEGEDLSLCAGAVSHLPLPHGGVAPAACATHPHQLQAALCMTGCQSKQLLWNLRRPPHPVVLQWIAEAWDQVPKQIIIDAFRHCGISSKLDGTENHLVMSHLRARSTTDVSADMSLGGTTCDNTRLLGRAPEEEEEEEAMQAEGVREVAVATGLEVLYQETPNYCGAAAEADRMIEPRETARHAWRVPDLGLATIAGHSCTSSVAGLALLILPACVAHVTAPTEMNLLEGGISSVFQPPSAAMAAVAVTLPTVASFATASAGKKAVPCKAAHVAALPVFRSTRSTAQRRGAALRVTCSSTKPEAEVAERVENAGEQEAFLASGFLEKATLMSAAAMTPLLLNVQLHRCSISPRRALLTALALLSRFSEGSHLFFLSDSVRDPSFIKPTPYRAHCLLPHPREQDAMAAGGEFGLLEGRTAALVHPFVMGGLFFTTLYAFYLGRQWKQVRVVGEKIQDLKKQLPAGEDAAAASPVSGEIATLTAQRAELVKGNYREKHFNVGSLLLGFGVLIAVEGCVNTWFRTGKLFPGPHLWAGATITVLWALAASLVPAMQKGNPVARKAHVALNMLNLALFVWQIPTGLEIVGKVFEFTSWP